MTNREKIINEIQNINIAELTSDLVKIKSYSGMESQEQEVAEYIRDFLAFNGIEVSLTDATPGRPNVIARIDGENHSIGKGPVLMLNGHIDTVPAYDMERAFEGEIREGRVFGRGSCDMKGPVAAMMAAMVAIKRSGIQLAGQLVFAGVADEEIAGIGTKALLKDWCGADAVIVGEPTSLKIGLGNKGLEWIKVDFFGRKVHGGSQDKGVNAINMAAKFINFITDEYVPKLAERKVEYLGSASLNIGTINGGDQPSTVADRCVVTFDRRSVPGESVEDVYREINDIINTLSQRYPGFKAKVRDCLEGKNDLPHEGFCTPPESHIVRAVQKAARAQDMEPPQLVGLSCWTDAGFIANNTDAECIIFGPGDMAVAHTADEYISIEQLQQAAIMYAMTALEYCGEV